MLKWQLAENMTRPYSDQTKVQMNYAISAPRIYKGRIESVVSKCIGFADMIQLTHLKIQQVLARMVPDGVFVDVDGLLNEADADAGAVVTVWGGDSTAGAALGDVDLPATERIKIVGGQGASAATGGTITGIIHYYVKDDGSISN